MKHSPYAVSCIGLHWNPAIEAGPCVTRGLRRLQPWKH